MGNLFEMLGAAFFLIMVLMGVLWLVYFFKKNASIVDIGWALSFVLASWAYFFIGDGYAPKKWVMTAMVTIWGCRLAWQLYQRYISSSEDSRYQELRSNWGSQNDAVKFFILFIFQGVLALILTLPFLIVGTAAAPGWNGIEVVGVLLWLMGVAGEAIADHQLFQFKQNPANKGKVCQEGLWYFSRHPNYFFEFIVWLGFFFFALEKTGGWLAVISPALMLCLLTKVSGIPLNEASALKTKSQAYAEYQKTTSSFVPWFKK